MSEDDDDVKYSLVMPFVCVKSVGGLYDDEAFTAGWQMGELDQKLDRLSLGETLIQPVLTTLTAQAQLIAMKHLCNMKMTVNEEHDSWADVEFFKVNPDWLSGE